jgi:hypothetical protein
MVIGKGLSRQLSLKAITKLVCCITDWGRMEQKLTFCKEYKITEYDAEYRDVLREFKRKYNIEDDLTVLQYEPEIPITKDYWTPDADEIALLTKEPDATARGYLQRSIFASWVEKQLILNAVIKTKNDNLKKMRD